jgi:hypothetical protein
LDSQLANNETEKSSPKVSKLPLPISDSPLVIDLPDGQKIVVGKMTQGSVIEVATWRGVGRPDSRTSRLMLGMGSGNVNEDSDAPEQGGTQSPGAAPSQRAPQKPQGIKGYIATAEHFIRNFNRINWSATFKALLASLTSKKAKKAAKGAPTSAAPQSDLQVEPSVAPSITVSRASDDADIEAWLNKITEKAARETNKGRTTNSASVKSAAKSKATVKKAAPKSSNARSSKK